MNLFELLIDAYLCKYLHDHRLIEHLFGDGFHVQLVKRSHDILKWMAENVFPRINHVSICLLHVQMNVA